MANYKEISKKTNNKPAAKANRPSSIKNGKHRNNLSDNRITRVLYKVILAAILVVVFYPPYLRGLFFESEYIKAELLVFIIFALFWVYKLIRKEKFAFETPFDYASLGFVIVYLVSILAAVSVNASKNELLKYCMYFSVFFMLTDLTRDFKNRTKVLWVITASALGVCFLGIDAAAGGNIVILANNILNYIYRIFGMEIPEKGTFFSLFVDGRINSTLQYPNTLAAYLMAAFAITITLMLLSDNRVKRIIASCAAFVFFVTFIFTLSRGAYIVFPFMLILFIIVLPKGMRTKYVLYLINPLIASIPAMIKISSIINSSQKSNAIWVWIFFGIVLCSVLYFISEYLIVFFEKVNWKIYIYIFGSIFIAVFVGLIVVFSAKQPITITHPLDSKVINIGITRSAILTPNNEYKLSFKLKGNYNESNQTQYSVFVRSKSENDILFDRYVTLAVAKGPVEHDSVQKEIEFIVPTDSKVVNIYFYNNTKGTDITFSDCIITDIKTGKLISVPLKYKYIPEVIFSRLQDIQVTKSNIIRTVLYKDGFKIFGDHWLIGAGGGAWSLLYFSYQSYLYFSTQAHNYYIQLAVETGVVGLFVLVFLLVSLIFIFIKQRYKEKINDKNLAVMQAALFTVLITLFVHAGIDFDFSYPAMLLLMWEILAIFNAGIKEVKAQIGRSYLFQLNDLKLNSGFGVLFSLVLVIMTSTIVVAISHFDKGSTALNKNKLDLAIWHFQRAAELNPSKPEYKINYSNLILNKSNNLSVEEQAKANKWVSEAEKQSKYDVSLLPYIVKYYFATGKIQEGIDISEKMIELRPFRAEEWEQLVSAYNSVLLYYLNNNKTVQSQEIANHGLDAITWAVEVNKRNLDPFIFNSAASQIIERFAYYSYNRNKESITSLDDIMFYSLPTMDIDDNGMPDQWNSVSPDIYKLKNEDNMLRVEKVTADKNTYIQSRLLLLRADSKYIIDLELYNENELNGIQYVLTGVSKQNDTLKLLNGVYTATITTPEEINTTYLRLFIEKDCVIKSLRITEIK